MTGKELIMEERQRQIVSLGYNSAHDARYERPIQILKQAALCYFKADNEDVQDLPKDWPWDAIFWKPKDRLQNLIRAGALYTAAKDALEFDVQSPNEERDIIITAIEKCESLIDSLLDSKPISSGF